MQLPFHTYGTKAQLETCFPIFSTGEVIHWHRCFHFFCMKFIFGDRDYDTFNEIVQIVLYFPVLRTGKGREENPKAKTNRFVNDKVADESQCLVHSTRSSSPIPTLRALRSGRREPTSPVRGRVQTGTACASKQMDPSCCAVGKQNSDACYQHRDTDQSSDPFKRQIR